VKLASLQVVVSVSYEFSFRHKMKFVFCRGHRCFERRICDKRRFSRAPL